MVIFDDNPDAPRPMLSLTFQENQQLKEKLEAANKEIALLRQRAEHRCEVCKTGINDWPMCPICHHLFGETH